MKKLFYLLLISMLFLFAGCNEKQNPDEFEEQKTPHIVVTNLPTELEVGDSAEFYVSIINSINQEYNVICYPENIVRIENNKITALSKGIVTIKFVSKTNEEVSSSFVLNVKDKNIVIPTINVTNMPSLLEAGEEAEFNVEISNVESGEYTVECIPENIVQINGNKIIALNEGNVTVKITSNEYDFLYSTHTIVVTKNADLTPSIILTNFPSNLKINEEVEFNIEFYNIETQEYLVEYETENIVEIVDNKIKGLNVGTTVIKIISKTNPEIFITKEVEVKEQLPFNLSLFLSKNIDNSYSAYALYNSNETIVNSIKVLIEGNYYNVYPINDKLNSKNIENVEVNFNDNQVIIYQLSDIVLNIDEELLLMHNHNFVDNKCECGLELSTENILLSITQEELNYIYIPRNKKFIESKIDILTQYYNNNDLAKIQEYIASKDYVLEYDGMLPSEYYIGYYAYNNYIEEINGRGSIRFSDLIRNPLIHIEKIRSVWDDIDAAYIIAREYINLEHSVNIEYRVNKYYKIFEQKGFEENRLYGGYYIEDVTSFSDQIISSLYNLNYNVFRCSTDEIKKNNDTFYELLEEIPTHTHNFIENTCSCGYKNPNSLKDVISCKEDPTQAKCSDPATWDWSYNIFNYDGKGIHITIYTGNIDLHNPESPYFSGSNKTLVNKNNVEAYYNVILDIKQYPDRAAWGPDRIHWINDSIDYGTIIGPTIVELDSSWLIGLARNESIISLGKYSNLNNDYIITEGLLKDINYNLSRPNLMASMYNGDVYGYFSYDINADCFLYYNQDLIDQYNLEDPATLWNNGEWDWSKFMELLRTAQDAFGPADETGMYAFGGFVSDLSYGVLAARGGKFVDLEDELVLFNNPTVIQMYEDLRQIKREGMWAPYMSDVSPEFAAGTQLFQHGQLWFLDSEMRFKDYCNFRISAVPYPTADGDALSKELYRCPFSSITCYGILNNFKNSSVIEDKVLLNILDDYLRGGEFFAYSTSVEEYKQYISTDESYKALLSVQDNFEKYCDYNFLVQLSIYMGNGSHWQGEGYCTWVSSILDLDYDLMTILPYYQASYQAKLEELLR